MKKTIISLITAAGFLLAGGINHQVEAQGVGINSSGSAPETSAGLDVDFTDKGMLIPRMNSTQRDGIVNPAQALMIFNTTTKCFEYWDDDAWQSLGCTVCPTPSASAEGTHSASSTDVTWNWNTVSGATGYKWNTTNSYGTATDNGNSTSYAQSGLSCGTSYTLYVWAYNTCGGSSSAVALTQSTSACPFTCGVSTITDADDNVYTTVSVGGVCWMKQNLNIGVYVASTSTGSAHSNASNNGTIEKYCYNNNQSMCTTYGGLYDWDEMMNYGASCNGTGQAQPQCSSPVQGICPSGWHIPSHYEWITLKRAVCTSGSCAGDFPFDITTQGWQGTSEGGNFLAGGSSGFQALLGGVRRDDGDFYAEGVGGYATFRTSSQYDASNAWRTYITDTNGQVHIGSYGKTWAFSVRCVKN